MKMATHFVRTTSGSLPTQRSVAFSVSRMAARAASTVASSRLRTVSASGGGGSGTMPHQQQLIFETRRHGCASHEESPRRVARLTTSASTRYSNGDGGNSSLSWSQMLSSFEKDFASQAAVASAKRTFSTSMTQNENLETLMDGDPLSHFDEVVQYDTRRELLDETPQNNAEKLLGSKDRDDNEGDGEAFHFQTIYSKMDSRPLPHNLVEATSPEEDRAVVVTETKVPFRIVAVNSPWEGLCGYTQSEARGRTLGELLQGPETDTPAVTALIDKLLHGEEAGLVVTNYAKDGRKFQNRLRVGELRNDKDRVTHFVGVLKEISESPDQFEEGEEKRMDA